jgi:pimeloyl-ACP methyl ester carboxylesterase
MRKLLSHTTRFFFCTILLLLCLWGTSCSQHGGGLQMVGEEEKEASTSNAKRKVVVTFLGMHGETSCFSRVNSALSQEDVTCIDASPQAAREHQGLCAKLDGYCMQTRNVHLGLGATRKQAEAAEERLRTVLGKDDEVVLCAHSQGGLVAVSFWELFHERYNIKGIVTMAAPLQGAAMMEPLSSYSTMKAMAYEQPCCTPKGIAARLLACCVPGCVWPSFKLCGCCCCAGVADMEPGSSLLRSQEDVYEQMAAQKLPFLNLTASSPAPDCFASFPFGKQGTKDIIGGGRGKESDNLLGTEKECLPIPLWHQAEEREIAADHGVANVPGHPRIFSHRQAVNHVVAFCKKNMGQKEE